MFVLFETKKTEKLKVLSKNLVLLSCCIVSVLFVSFRKEDSSTSELVVVLSLPACFQETEVPSPLIVCGEGPVSCRHCWSCWWLCSSAVWEDCCGAGLRAESLACWCWSHRRSAGAGCWRSFDWDRGCWDWRRWWSQLGSDWRELNLFSWQDKISVQYAEMHSLSLSQAPGYF